MCPGGEVILWFESPAPTTRAEVEATFDQMSALARTALPDPGVQFVEKDAPCELTGRRGTCRSIHATIGEQHGSFVIGLTVDELPGVTAMCSDMSPPHVSCRGLIDLQ